MADPGSALERLRVLHAQIRACTGCRLHVGRTQAVPGAGPSVARVMIVGEAPGATEDSVGRPFVGQAGRLLDTLLEGIGLARGDVYVTNVVKCRPPANRDPEPDEVEACRPYLDRQLALIRPRIVVLLGRHALERLLPGHGPISRVHGQPVIRAGVTYFPIFHPAAALHNRGLLSELEADFRALARYLESGPAPEAPPPSTAPASSAAPVEAGVDTSPPPGHQLRLF